MNGDDLKLSRSTTSFDNKSNLSASPLIPQAQRAFQPMQAQAAQSGSSEGASSHSAGQLSAFASAAAHHQQTHAHTQASSKAGPVSQQALPSFAQLVSVATHQTAEQAASAVISSAKAAAASKRRKLQENSSGSSGNSGEAGGSGDVQGSTSRLDDSEAERLENDKERKRKLRLLKNRQSAALSRQRKKEYIGCLERKVDDLNMENTEYQTRLSSLATQHWEAQHVIEDLQGQVTNLKEENERLRVAATLSGYSRSGSSSPNSSGATTPAIHAHQTISAEASDPSPQSARAQDASAGDSS